MIWVGFIEEGWKYHQRIDSNKGLAVGLNRVGRTGLSKYFNIRVGNSQMVSKGQTSLALFRVFIS